MSLINRKAVKQAILDTATKQGRTDFTRVGAASFDYLEGAIQNLINDGVLQHPAVGKTINLGEVAPAALETPAETPAAE